MELAQNRVLMMGFNISSSVPWGSVTTLLVILYSICNVD